MLIDDRNVDVCDATDFARRKKKIGKILRCISTKNVINRNDLFVSFILCKSPVYFPYEHVGRYSNELCDRKTLSTISRFFISCRVIEISGVSGVSALAVAFARGTIARVARYI